MLNHVLYGVIWSVMEEQCIHPSDVQNYLICLAGTQTAPVEIIRVTLAHFQTTYSYQSRSSVCNIYIHLYFVIETAKTNQIIRLE